jgi:dTDP-4-dehydrorhamnose reductase
MNRWLVTGAGGQLGRAVVAALGDADVVALNRESMDITDQDVVFDVIQSVRPTIVLNTAAYTAVDAAETDEERAYAVNGLGPGHVARACAETGALLVHVSTDYVFSGDARQPYTEDATTSPQTAYGRSKLAGERAVRHALEAGYVVRSAWLFGARGSNFLTTMMRLERERATVAVVDDQRGSPTSVCDLAASLIVLATSGVPFGVYHYSNMGDTTWFGLAQAIFTELGADPERVIPVPTDATRRPARRPSYSVLDTSRWRSTGLPVPPNWAEALRCAVADAQQSSASGS